MHDVSSTLSRVTILQCERTVSQVVCISYAKNRQVSYSYRALYILLTDARMYEMHKLTKTWNPDLLRWVAILSTHQQSLRVLNSQECRNNDYNL